MPIPLSPAAGQKAQCHQRAEVLSRLQAPMSSTCRCRDDFGRRSGSEGIGITVTPLDFTGTARRAGRPISLSGLGGGALTHVSARGKFRLGVVASSIDRLAEVAKNTVVAALGHLKDRLSRIEVHLADVNAAKGGDDDILCTIEACPEGMQPQAVTHADANVEAALRGASRKIRNLLDSEFGKLGRR
jgi:hypothetical protein